MNGGIGVGQHVLCKCTIVPEASHLPLLTESRVSACRSPHVLLTANTLPTRVLEVQDANSIANFPVALYLGAYLHDLASRFMGRNYGQACWELALQDLQIRMTEACRVHLNEKIMLAACRYRSFAELIRFVELRVKVSDVFSM